MDNKLTKILKTKDYSQQASEYLREIIKKYPYFSPALYMYLLSIRAKDNIEFKNELVKYSTYITNYRTFIKRVLEIDRLKAENKLKINSDIEATQLAQETYERSKERHEQIVQEIIEPKIDKLRQLSELSKQKPTEKAGTAKQDQEQPSQDNKQEAKPEATETKTEIKPETPTTGQTTDKQPAEQAQPATEQTKTETTSEKAEISIDDIFKKIEELKKQKLKAASDFQKRIDTVDKMIEDQKIREEVPVSSGKKQEKPRTKPETPKSTDQQQQKTIVEKKEDKEEKQEVKTVKEEKKEVKTVKTETKTTTEKEPKHKMHTKIIDDTEVDTFIQIALDSVKNKKSGSSQEKTADKKQEKAEQPEKPAQETPKPAEKSTQSSAAKTQSTAKQPDQIQVNIDKPETTNKLTAQKPQEDSSKSAADRILEEIARRREMRKKKQLELIERFLEEEPSIDRRKSPAIEGDLSEPHTKEVEIVTEKMAQIYELQGLYDKAIEIYEKLILQKPEKKDYFAQKIQKLKQQIN